MAIEYLDQELEGRINSLKTELDICEGQRGIISIIRVLKSIESLKQGYNKVENCINISRKGISAFIDLLNSNEYLKGYNNGGNDYFGKYPKEYKYDYYYLTLGTGIVLELGFCETELKGSTNPIKESENLSIELFADSQDLRIKVDSERNGWPRIEFLTQNGDRVYDSNTTKENLEFNNQMLNEVLTPISVEDLTNRFLNMIQNQNEDVIKK